MPAGGPRATSVSGLAPETWMLIALTLVAGVLRFATVTSQSYWFDEALTAHEMRLPFAAMWSSLLTHETNPPLYYVLTWLWSRLFGVGEVSLRFISALAGTAVVPITYACGKELISRRAGLIAAALAAVSPFMVWYSQEARSYMLFAALCGTSLLFAARCARAPSLRNHVGWVISGSLAILTHFFAGFLIGPEAIWLLLLLKRGRVTVTASAVLAAVQLALLPLIVHDTSHPIASWISGFPLSVRIEQVPVEFALGTLYRGSLASHGLLIGACAAIVCGALIVLGGTRGERRAGALIAAIAGFILLVPLALTQVGHDYFDVRNLMPVWIPLALLVALACSTARTQALGFGLATALVGLFVIAGIRIDSGAQYQRPNWRGAAAALGSPSGARAIVAYDGAFAAGPLAIYMPRLPWLSSPPVATRLGEVDLIGSSWQDVSPTLPPGARLLSRRSFDGILVARFVLAPVWSLTPAALAGRAAGLLTPARPAPTVLIQGPPA